ncbi:hypothetical protein VNI00_006623 [Paramarasmius palmivorus]|uniref:Uncharacterized protein n=1 Tax=Paramarasmius palmivorus TaxID=297713 RepID=A0AAW0DAW9_9AGAR
MDSLQRLYDIAWIQKDRAKLYTPIPNTLSSARSASPPANQRRLSYDGSIIQHFKMRYPSSMDKEWGMLTDSNAAAATHEGETDDESKMVVDSDKAEEDKLLEIDWQTEKEIHLAKQAFIVTGSPGIVIEPPWNVQLSESRIVVAASRRKLRFKWLEKFGMPYYKWIMKPTSLRELVIMNPYQKGRITMEQLYAFAELFGTCARQVYQHAEDPETYRKNLDQSDNDQTSNWIVGVYPGPTRKEPYVAIYTFEILRLAQDRFASEWDQRVWGLFDALRQNPYTRAPAGRILENRLHEALAEGGTWKGTEMTARSGGPKGNKNTYFTDNVFGQRHVWLSLGPGAEISTTEPPKVGRTALTVHRFRSGELDGTLTTGYYCPFSQTYPTFGSSVLDVERETVVIIDYTMLMEHDVKAKGLQFLVENWQKSGYRICYVIITDDRDETKTVDIPILKTYEHVIREKVHICMSKKDLFPNAPADGSSSLRVWGYKPSK